MNHARRALLLTPLALALALGPATPALAGDSPAPNGSVIGDWKTRAEGFKQTVTFDKKGRVYGNAGCNNFTGSYRVKADSIEIGPLASTLKYCDGRMDGEQAFLKAVQESTSYRATDTVLKLYSPDGKLRLKAA